MALGTFQEMVRQRLPFLPTDAATNTIIDKQVCESQWFLQKYTALSDVEVEDESEYTGVTRMTVADLTAYDLTVREVIKTMGGVEGAAATGNRSIKKGTAGPVAGEFHFHKASDGASLQMQANELLPEMKERLCRNGSVLGWALPMCDSGECDTPPFIIHIEED